MFCLAGCIVSEDTYKSTIIPYINKLKNDIFGSDSVILHEIEIRKASKSSPYQVMLNQEKRTKFWNQMILLFDSPNLFWTIGTAINCIEYKKLYSSPYINDEYYIALQLILENFVHFLEMKNGYGTVYIESRNAVEDDRLRNHYHILKANGTLFMNKSALQKRLGTINFPLKNDNNIGLQLADFIPNPLARHYHNIKQKEPTLFPQIVSKLYDGSVRMPQRFGLKCIP